MSKASIIQTVNAQVAGNFSTIPVAYQNVTFDKTAHKEFVRVNTNFSVEEQKTMGSGQILYRQWGHVGFQIFTEAGKNPLKGAQIADELATLFRSKRINTIQFYAPDGGQSTLTDDGFFLTVFTVEFYDNQFLTVDL